MILKNFTRYHHIMVKILLLLFIFFISKNALATITAETLIESYDNSETREDALIYINGAGDAMMWSSVYSEIMNKKPIFCRPHKLKLDAEGYYQILKIEYFKNPKKNKTLQVNHLLIRAMVSAFPCK